MSDNAVVSNASTSFNPDIPVRSTETAAGKQIQHVRLDVGNGSAESVITAANPLPVSGSFTASIAKASSINTEAIVNVTTSNTALLSANTNRKGGRIKNIGDEYVYVSFSNTATTSKPSRIAPGEAITLADGAVCYTGDVAAICSQNSSNVEVVEL